MEIKRIDYTPKFLKSFKGLRSEIQAQLIKREPWFRADCFDSRLKTHKLKGKLIPYWSFSVNYSYRVLFAFEDEHRVTFIDIGPHSIYQ